MSGEQRHLLVVGASGVIGAAAVEQFSRTEGWAVTALSRRRPVVGPACAFAHVSVDLTDAAATAAALATLPPVTHMIKPSNAIGATYLFTVIAWSGDTNDVGVAFHLASFVAGANWYVDGGSVGHVQI